MFAVSRLSRAFTLFLLFGSITSIRVAGWGPLAHDAIGREAVGDANARVYHSLPDSWPSSDLNRITDWSAWTHGVQRTGSAFGVPRVPEYAPENPGEVMYASCRSQGPSCTPLARATALGFLAHGVEDREVHWGYSGGGIYQTWKNHPVKEQWADCVVYREILKGTFDNRGQATSLPSVGNDGDARLIQLAQQDFNGNPRNKQDTLDRGRRTKLSRVEPVSEIQKRIDGYRSDLKDELLEVNRNNCGSLDDTARKKGWDSNEAQRHYRAAVASVKQVYAAHPF